MHKTAGRGRTRRAPEKMMEEIVVAPGKALKTRAGDLLSGRHARCQATDGGFVEGQVRPLVVGAMNKGTKALQIES